jgi:hypothetical protein
MQLYRRALDQGRRGKLWSMLTGRPRCLLALAVVEANCKIRARCDAGLRTVPIDQICGSEGRAGDFDRDFNPLQRYTQQRWLGIAAARREGRRLPPVALIRVGNLHFVRDGHHRISVARALGQLAIEATVEVWQVDGSLPWDASTRAPGREPMNLPKGVEHVLGRLQREGARLQERALVKVHDLLGAVRMALRRPVLPRPGVEEL